MHWPFMVALVMAIPIIVFPAFLWYLDIGDIYAAAWGARKRTDGRRPKGSVAVSRHEATVRRSIR